MKKFLFVYAIFMSVGSVFAMESQRKQVQFQLTKVDNAQNGLEILQKSMNQDVNFGKNGQHKTLLTKHLLESLAGIKYNTQGMKIEWNTEFIESAIVFNYKKDIPQKKATKFESFAQTWPKTSEVVKKVNNPFTHIFFGIVLGVFFQKYGYTPFK